MKIPTFILLLLANAASAADGVYTQTNGTTMLGSGPSSGPQLWGTNAVDGSITNVNNDGGQPVQIYPDGSITLRHVISFRDGADIGENQVAGDLSLNPVDGSGRIVAVSGGFEGNGADLTNLNASQLASGTVPTARLDTLLNQYPAALTNKDTRGLTLVGSISSTNGYASFLNNKAAPTSITVGASVFNYTNTSTVNIQVFLDANGANTAVTFNGTATFSALVGGDHTIILQPGDRIGVTYSVQTPIMRYREF